MRATMHMLLYQSAVRCLLPRQQQKLHRIFCAAVSAGCKAFKALASSASCTFPAFSQRYIMQPWEAVTSSLYRLGAMHLSSTLLNIQQHGVCHACRWAMYTQTGQMVIYQQTQRFQQCTHAGVSDIFPACSHKMPMVWRSWPQRSSAYTTTRTLALSVA